MKENILVSNKDTTILTILVLSLFLQIRLTTPAFIIRPFDLLTMFIFFYAYMSMSRNTIADQKLSSGFFYLFPFFIIHSLSALKIGNLNFFREFFQVLIFIGFAYSLSYFKTKIDGKKITINLLLGSICIMAFSIFYHLQKGHLVGWKELPDTRIIFTVISVLIFAYLNISKALLVFFFLFVLHYSQGNILIIVVISILAYVFLSLLANYLDEGYLKVKIDTITNLFVTGNYQYYFDTKTFSEYDTYSNVARVFAFSVSKDYFLENPILGLGTNNFIHIYMDQYNYLPKFFWVGIHNEFQRVLVENGLVGLFFYLFIWYKSWTRTKNITIKAKKNGLINDLNYRFCTYSIYLACIFYVGSEATSLRSFIILIFISLLPDYLNYHLSLKTKEKI